jgi:hypothetical protein
MYGVDIPIRTILDVDSEIPQPILGKKDVAIWLVKLIPFCLGLVNDLFDVIFQNVPVFERLLNFIADREFGFFPSHKYEPPDAIFD